MADSLEICLRPDEGKAANFILYGVWKEATGQTNFGRNNFGLIIDRVEDVVNLGFSDGIGEPNFEDFVIRVSGNTAWIP